MESVKEIPAFYVVYLYSLFVFYTKIIRTVCTQTLLCFPLLCALCFVRKIGIIIIIIIIIF